MPTITITDNQRESMFIDAIEGTVTRGWLSLSSSMEKVILSTLGKKASGSFSVLMWNALKKGALIPLRDREGKKRVTISYAKILKGEQVMAEKYPYSFADIVMGDADAVTADIWLQCAILGDHLYS
jgi:hypothetical protein